MSKRFNGLSPESLQDALYHVGMLLQERPTFEIPLVNSPDSRLPEGTMLDALSALHGLQTEWLSDAWARWAEIGLDAWERAVKESLEHDMLYRSGRRPHIPPGGYLLGTLDAFIEKPKVDKHFVRLDDRYLDLLSAIRLHPMMTRKTRVWWRDCLLRRIRKRAGEDSTAFNLFAKKYGFRITYEAFCAYERSR
jgi:hypothetical protein